MKVMNNSSNRRCSKYSLILVGGATHIYDYSRKKRSRKSTTEIFQQKYFAMKYIALSLTTDRHNEEKYNYIPKMFQVAMTLKKQHLGPIRSKAKNGVANKNYLYGIILYDVERCVIGTTSTRLLTY